MTESQLMLAIGGIAGLIVLPLLVMLAVRLIVPHWYGVASVKWLKRIEVLTQPFIGEFESGHYMYQWADRPPERVTVMRPRARITVPRRGASRS